MYEDDNKIHISNDSLPTDFSLDDILAEYGAEEPEPPEQDDTAERSKRIVLDALDGNVSEVSFSSIDDIIGDAVQEQRTASEKAPPRRKHSAQRPENEAGGREHEKSPELTEREEEVISRIEREQPPASGESDSPEYDVSELADSDGEERYAPKSFPEKEVSSADGDAERRDKLKERLLSPLVGLLALVALRRGQRRKADARTDVRSTVGEDEDVPEPDPEKAVKLYGSQMRALKGRVRLAAVLCLVMLYLSFAFYSKLPLAGALNGSVRAVSAVMLVFELTVMLTGLDVFTSGILSLAGGRPGYESLAAVSCVLSVLDALVIVLSGHTEWGLPFCAVSSVSLCFAMWGNCCTCRGCRYSFRVLAASRRAHAVMSRSGITPETPALAKSDSGTRGFIKRTEEADAGEYVYSLLSPIIMAMALVLGLLASVAHGRGGAAVHCISVIAAVGAAFSAGICFSLPFSIAAKRLYHSGAAIAGWAGARDIGRCRRIVIRDADLFPQGTTEIKGIRILEGAFTDKVISYTGSVIMSSGSGLSQPFSELIRRNGYSLSRVESFEVHDGGGMKAVVNGESVYVGNAGFMNLMGIRVPQKLTTKTSVFSAINGSLVGIFTVEYKPAASVQRALALLLRSGREPVFATRDFNITPVMVKKKFRMPTDGFDFPSCTERFRMSGEQQGEDVLPAGVVSRDGLGPFADISDLGRRLYVSARTGAAISAVGSVLGAVIMFLLCWLGAFDSATASNAAIFMLLWLIPTGVLSWGLQR